MQEGIPVLRYYLSVKTLRPSASLCSVSTLFQSLKRIDSIECARSSDTRQNTRNWNENDRHFFGRHFLAVVVVVVVAVAVVVLSRFLLRCLLILGRKDMSQILKIDWFKYNLTKNDIAIKLK